MKKGGGRQKRWKECIMMEGWELHMCKVLIEIEMNTVYSQAPNKAYFKNAKGQSLYIWLIVIHLPQLKSNQTDLYTQCWVKFITKTEAIASLLLSFESGTCKNSNVHFNEVNSSIHAIAAGDPPHALGFDPINSNLYARSRWYGAIRSARKNSYLLSCKCAAARKQDGLVAVHAKVPIVVPVVHAWNWHDSTEIYFHIRCWGTRCYIGSRGTAIRRCSSNSIHDCIELRLSCRKGRRYHASTDGKVTYAKYGHCSRSVSIDNSYRTKRWNSK